MSNGIFGDLFDLNDDGNLDCFEQGLEFMLCDISYTINRKIV